MAAAGLAPVLTALALRSHELGLVRGNFDRAYPHGLGLIIRDLIANGRWSELPLLGITSSIDAPNPTLASYVWAAISLVDGSAYSATVLIVLLSLLVPACAFALARSRAGTLAGFVAGMLAATSPWGHWIARGAWLQGAIEVFAAVIAWLLIAGIVRGRPRWLAWAGVVAALAMQTYLVAFGLAAQVAAAVVAGGGASPRLRRGAAVAIGACLISGLVYAGVLLAQSRSPVARSSSPPPAVTAAINLDPVTHFLRIASGRDYENTFVESDTPGFELRDALSDARADVVDVLIVLGGLSLLAASRRDPAARAMLSWAVLPVLGSLIVSSVVFPAWKVHVFYIMAGSPMSYVLAALPVGWIGRMTSAPARAVAATGALIVLGAVAAVSVWNLQGDVEATRRFPYNHDGLPSLTLDVQRRLAADMRRECDTVSAQEDAAWLASMLGEARRARAGAYRLSGPHAVWTLPPIGAHCAFQVEGQPAGITVTRTLEVPGLRRTDKLPLTITWSRVDSVALAQGARLTTNIGWELVRLDAPASAAPGERVSVSHVWRVAGLPTESHAAWYYAPFVKLAAPDGRVIVDIDNAPSVIGAAWRPGELIASTVRFEVPRDAAPGHYTLRLSLFDPNQAKNAVYFDFARPGEPIVELSLPMSVTAPLR